MNEEIMINNTPNAQRIWKAIGSSFENAAQAIFELVDNAISNFRGHVHNTDLVRMIRITARSLGSDVEVSVEDGGTGIRDLDNALTLAGDNGQESPLNEHGFGLKHALAYMDSNGCSWEILTRTGRDRDLNRFVRVRPPYDFGSSPKEMENGGVDSVNRQLFGIWCTMYGARNRNVAAYRPLTEICDDFAAVLGDGEYFFSRIMDNDYIVRYVALYSVEVTEGILWVIRAFLWNRELLDHYWELTEEGENGHEKTVDDI